MKPFINKGFIDINHISQLNATSLKTIFMSVRIKCHVGHF
jgi:hypothetical protein